MRDYHKSLICLSLALKVQFLQNLFLVRHHFVVDIDRIEVAHNVKVIRLASAADPATSQLAAAKRFDGLGGPTRLVGADCAFLAAFATRKLRRPDALSTVIRHVKGSSLRDVDRLI